MAKRVRAADPDEEYRTKDEVEEDEDLEEEEGEEELGDDDDDEEIEEEDVEEDDDDDEEEADGDDAEEVQEEQPVKRRRGRPPGSGKKRGAKPGRFQPLQVPLQENGKPYAIVNDELDLPEDEEGEKKIDKLGFLKGSREFRLRTFTILGKGSRQYMLATEPARCIGFRDSYLLFQRHRMLLKVQLGDDEKFDLIDRGLIPHSYKGRTLGAVTARSVFREFGARVIVGGHRVVDDYYEAEAISEGHTADELADPEDKLPAEGNPYDKNQYCAWYNAPQPDSAAIYENNLKSVLKQQNEAVSPNGSGEARRDESEDANAQQSGNAAPDSELWETSLQSTANFNRFLNKGRAGAMAAARYTMGAEGPEGGIVDPHTGVRFVPSSTQSTRARTDRVSKKAPRGAVMFTTVMNAHTVGTKLGSISPAVYADADDATKMAIAEQIRKESVL